MRLRSPSALHNHGCFTGNIDTAEPNPHQERAVQMLVHSLQRDFCPLLLWCLNWGRYFLFLSSDSLHCPPQGRKNASLKLLLSLPRFFLSFFPSLSCLSSLVSGWNGGRGEDGGCAFSCVFEVLWSEKEALVTIIMAFVLQQKVSLCMNKIHTHSQASAVECVIEFPPIAAQTDTHWHRWGDNWDHGRSSSLFTLYRLFSRSYSQQASKCLTLTIIWLLYKRHIFITPSVWKFGNTFGF